jgi:hypothetical protein
MTNEANDFMGGASTSTKEGVTPPAKPIGKAQIAEAMKRAKAKILLGINFNYPKGEYYEYRNPKTSY